MGSFVLGGTRDIRRQILGAIVIFVLFFAGAGSDAQESLPPNFDARIAEAVQALKSGNSDYAAKILTGAVRHGIKHPIVYHNLGVIAMLRGNYSEAVTQFRQSLALQPDYGPSRLLLGSSLLALKRNTEALRELKRAGTILPQEPQVHLQLGKAYEALGNWIAAVQEFQTLIRLAPQEPEYSYQLSNAWTKLADWSLRQIIALNPNSARLFQGLGLEYAAQGKYDQALNAYQEAARYDPKLPELHLAMARILFEKKEFDKALAEVELELQLIPESRAAAMAKEKIEAAKAAAP